MASLTRGLAMVARRDNEWAGMPMPLEGERLIVEKSYPFAEAFAKLNGRRREEPIQESPDVKLRNRWWSTRLRSDIFVIEDQKGITGGPLKLFHSLDCQLQTLGACDAWSLETESVAMESLRGMVRHHQFRQYLLTGSFLETSKRSGVTYLFRRLRPTVAMSAATGKVRILCALCLHPIGYYEGSWAGSLCPTDDVIAHLALMRGDEKMFWKRANQHQPNRPEAGL